MRFALTLGEGQQFTANNSQSVAVSPDGTKLVYEEDFHGGEVCLNLSLCPAA